MNIPEVSLFPIGGANEAFAQYFIGQSYLNMLPFLWPLQEH